MSWATFFDGASRARHAPAILEWVTRRRWYRGKARAPTGAQIVDVVSMRAPSGDAREAPVPHRTGARPRLHLGQGAIGAMGLTRKEEPSDARLTHVVLLRVTYAQGDAETYVVPLGLRVGEAAAALERALPNAVVMRAKVDGADAVVHDALSIDDAVGAHGFADAALEAIATQSTLEGSAGAIRGARLRGYAAAARGELRARSSTAEQTNSAIFYGDRLMMKVFRRLDEGIHPELEIGAYLGAHERFTAAPRVVGSLQYARTGGAPAALAIVQELVRHRGDAWSIMLAELTRRVTSDALTPESIASFEHALARLGQRTAELHVALAAETNDPAFAPERLTEEARAGLVEGARALLARTLAQLQERMPHLPEGARRRAQEVLARATELNARAGAIASTPTSRGPRGDLEEGALTRIHGDLHLGQVLAVEDDFVIIDFEGEPSRTLDERREKSSPLRDVAGMLRSFDYAAATIARAHAPRPDVRAWCEAWNVYARRTYLAAYLGVAAGASFLPRDEPIMRALLEFFLLEKCVYEVGYELNNRPDWVDIPLEGMAALLSRDAATR